MDPFPHTCNYLIRMGPAVDNAIERFFFARTGNSNIIFKCSGVLFSHVGTRSLPSKP